MSPQPGTRSDNRLAIRLAADPASVSGARRFVGDALRWWNAADLFDDATLCVSEFATNVALHARCDFMTVALHRLPGGVRLGVADDGAVPAAAVAPRPSFPNPADPDTPVRLEDEATTGRGLAIVFLLATSWGVDTTDDGKVIWCDLQHEAHDSAVEGPVVSDDRASAAPPSLPPDWAVVRLAGRRVLALQGAVNRADALCEQMHMLTVASPGRSGPCVGGWHTRCLTSSATMPRR